MKILDRITLLKAGYSKDDINAMIEEEAKELKEKGTDEKGTELNENYKDVLISLANEVKTLKESIQDNNLKNVELTGPTNTVDEAVRILGGLINPQINEEDK